MATLISIADGNFTSASSWAVAEAGASAELLTISNSTTTTVSYVYSSAFTGTNTKVVDGVALFLRRVNTTGTFTVALSEDNGTTATRTVTVNVSDLPDSNSWVFFKFATTLTLDGGTDYKVGVLSSSAGSVTVFRNATAGNWARILRTTNTAAPAAGDVMFILGQFTGAGAYTAYAITMDNTASTDFGTGVAGSDGLTIGMYGTLTWGTAATTNYYLKLSGDLNIYSQGTLNMGTTGTPCPRDSTMWLQFDCVSTSSADFGLFVADGATFRAQGQSRTSGKNIWYCNLSSDAAVNATTLNVDTDTGWLDNDVIAIAPTTRTATQREKGTLNGAAGASSLTVDGFAGAGGGLAFAHEGTSPVVAEIVLLTRNVKISGASSSATASFDISFNSLNNVTVDVDWTEIYWIRDLFIYGLAGSTTSNVSFAYSSYYESGRLFQSGATTVQNYEITNCAFYSTAQITFQRNVTGGSLTFTNNILIYIAPAVAPAVNTNTGTFNNIILAGSTTAGITLGGGVAETNYSNITVHSCAGAGIATGSRPNGNTVTMLFDNFKIWRNAGGLNIASIDGQAITIKNSNFFANTTYNITVACSPFLVLDNVTLAADSSFATTNGITFSGGVMIAKFYNCSFGVVSGIYRAHTTDINFANRPIVQIELYDTTLASATEVASTSTLTLTSYVKSSNHDNTTEAFKSWFIGGIIQNDSTIYNNAAPSERLSPVSNTINLESSSRLVAVDSSSNVTISAYVRKSSSGDGAEYNGIQPTLILKKNLAVGVANDQILATMTSSSGSWEQLSGTTPSANNNGVFEFAVSCNGTAGWINVDDWSVS